MAQGTSISKLIRKTRLKKYWKRGYKGAGVTVAVIDRGFRNLDRLIAEGRVSAIPEDLRFNFVDTDSHGLEGPDTDDGLHGTATLEILTLFAPEARLVAVRSLGYTGQFARAIEKVLDLGVDFFLVNMGFVGYPDGRSPFSLMMADAASRRTLPVGSINNQALSYTGTFNYQDGYTSFGDGDTNYIEILDTNGRPVNVYLDWEPGRGADLALELFRREGNRLILTAETDQRGSETHLQCWEQLTWSGIENPVVRVWSNTPNTNVRFRLLNFDLWSRFSIVNSATTLTVPSDALHTFTVGAVRADNYTAAGREFYSGHGPTADGRMKPDIMGAARIWSHTWGGESFGTSCATPMAVGHMAVLKSSNPKLRSSRLRKTLEASAVDAGEEGKDNSFGSGLLRLPKLKKK